MMTVGMHQSVHVRAVTLQLGEAKECLQSLALALLVVKYLLVIEQAFFRTLQTIFCVLLRLMHREKEKKMVLLHLRTTQG